MVVVRILFVLLSRLLRKLFNMFIVIVRLRSVIFVCFGFSVLMWLFVSMV